LSAIESGSHLNCPRCGLSIRVRAGWLAVEHCPRCLGRSRIAVQMFASALPTVDLYAEGAEPEEEPTVPGAGPRGSS